MFRSHVVMALVLVVAGCDRVAAPEPPAENPFISSVIVESSRAAYTGRCPPPPDRAPAFTATITVVRGPATVVYQWLASDGGSADPGRRTLRFPGPGRQSSTATFVETSYIHRAVLADWIGVYLISPDAVESNHMTFRTACTPARDDPPNPDDALAPGDILGRAYPSGSPAR